MQKEDVDQVYLREQVVKDDESSDIGFDELVKEEADHDIKFRTLSWHRTTFLVSIVSGQADEQLFGEYVCLAILALPWSFSVLGWGTGLVVQIGTGFITWCRIPTDVLTLRHLVHPLEVLYEAPEGSRHRRHCSCAVPRMSQVCARGITSDAGGQLCSWDGIPCLHRSQE